MKDLSTQTFAQATAAENDPRPVPSALLFYAHPDDETIALGARLGRFANAHLVHVTDGVPHREDVPRAHGFSSMLEYCDARQQELRNVLDAASIPSIDRECLEVPDQEASYQLTWLTHRLLLLLRIHQPQVVFTHPFEGGHPDHDACAFAVHHAIGLLRFRHEPAPIIVESPFYHAAKFGRGMEIGTFLPSEHETVEIAYLLPPGTAAQAGLTRSLHQPAQHPQQLPRLRGALSHRASLTSFVAHPILDRSSMTTTPGCEIERFLGDLAWEAADALDEETKAACC